MGLDLKLEGVMEANWMKDYRLIGIITIFILISLLLGTFFVRGRISFEEKRVEILPSPVEQEQETEEETKVTNLEDLTGEEATGLAKRVLGQDQIFYTINANLKKLSKKNFYGVWLVRGNPGETDFDYVLIGKLKRENGFFSLEFSKEKDFLDYNGVLITLESNDDKIPETHILKGSF